MVASVRLARLAAAGLGLVLTGCAGGAPTADSLVALFGEAAYRADRPILTKFEKTVLTLAVTGEPGPHSDAARAHLEARLARLSDLTGLSFAAAADGEDADVRVVLEDAAYVDLSRKFLCSATYRIEDRALTAMLVKIGVRTAVGEPQTLADRIGRCVDHELMHGIGFLNHPLDTYLPTVLATHQNMQQRPRAWTANDEILIRTLYDPRLKAGMSRDEATPIVRAIIAGMLAPEPRQRP